MLLVAIIRAIRRIIIAAIAVTTVDAVPMYRVDVAQRLRIENTNSLTEFIFCTAVMIACELNAWITGQKK